LIVTIEIFDIIVRGNWWFKSPFYPILFALFDIRFHLYIITAWNSITHIFLLNCNLENHFVNCSLCLTSDFHSSNKFYLFSSNFDLYYDTTFITSISPINIKLSIKNTHTSPPKLMKNLGATLRINMISQILRSKIKVVVNPQPRWNLIQIMCRLIHLILRWVGRI
jgi:hypothetical protein